MHIRAAVVEEKSSLFVLRDLELDDPHPGEVLIRIVATGVCQASTGSPMKKASRARSSKGQYADLAVLSADYFKVPDEQIHNLVSVLTVVGGRFVHSDDEFGSLAPPLPPAMPDWSPVNHFGGYFKPAASASAMHRLAQAAWGCNTRCSVHGHAHGRAYQDAVDGR